MKMGALVFVFGLFLMIFMVGGVMAIQYKPLERFSSYMDSSPNKINNGEISKSGNFKIIRTIQISSTEGYGIGTFSISCNYPFGDVDGKVVECDINLIDKDGRDYSSHSFLSLNKIKNVTSCGVNYCDEYKIWGNADLQYFSQTESILMRRLSASLYLQFRGKMGENLTNGVDDLMLFGDYFTFERNEEIINNIEQNQTSQNQRISTLESWKQIISDTITNFITTIIEHTTKIDNHETRITALENKPIQNNTGTFPNYFKYLSSSERKAMVCGYSRDNHLTSINDLGWNCTITYKVNQYTKKETTTCKCVGK